MNARLILAGALLAGATQTAFAHETWLTPSAFRAAAGERVRLDLSSGMGFPRLESPIRAERIAKAAFRLAGAQAALTGFEAGTESLRIHQAFPRDGVATIWLDLKPKEIELTDDQVTEYLDEIDARPEVRSAWAARKGQAPWRETYVKHAKTFVVVGGSGSDASWGEPVGSMLELVPKTSPAGLRAGGRLAVRLLAQGRPLPGLPVGLMVEGKPGRVFQTTDGQGEAVFSIPQMRQAGRAMLFAVRLVPAGDGTSWSSDFCTMTFAVRP